MAFPFFKPKAKPLTAVAGTQALSGVETTVAPEEVVIYVDGENLVDIIAQLRAAGSPGTAE